MWGHGWRAMPPGSEVWKYVTRRDDKTVVCNVCGSQLASSSSATVLRLHLQRNHRIHFTEEPDRNNLQGTNGHAEKTPCAKEQSPKITKLIGIESPITHTSQSSRRISEMLRECAARLEEGEDLERHSILGVGELTEDELSPVLRSSQPASGGRSPAREPGSREPGSREQWPAWGFFKKLNERCVECTLCRKQLCFHASTASLREHLRRKHRLGEPERRPCPDEGSSSSESAGPEPEPKKNKAVRWGPEAGPPSDEAMDELLLGMVFRDLQPFSLVSDAGFRRLLARLQPGYTLPSAARLAGCLRRRYALCRLRLEAALRSAGSLALSAHGWSGRPGGRPYLTVSAHSLDRRWRPVRWVLSSSPEPPAEQQQQLLSAAVADFGLSGRAVTCVVHDGPRPPARPAWPTLGCAGRGLQRCLEHGLRLQEVQVALGAARGLVSRAQRSGRAPADLLLDSPSRWSSTLAMCRRLLDARPALRQEPGAADLPRAQWELLRDLLAALQPLCVALAFLAEEENASVSSLLPTLHGVLAQLSGQPGPLAQAVSAEVRAELAKSWPREGSDEVLGQPAALAAFLDPRFKDLRFLSPGSREAVRRGVKTLLAAASDEPSPAEPQASDYDLLFGHDPVDRMPGVHQQLESYLAEPLRQRGTDPFRWWRDNAHRFPALAGLARRYLAVPATSVAGDRPFFNCARLPGESGAPLLPEHLDQIVFLHKNFDDLELMKGLDG